MSPAHVLQPTYDRFKRELMQGTWAQNVRLEAARIAEEYGVSTTPVRDCLNLLVGEGMIDFRPGEGYRTRVIAERDLAELLNTNSVLLIAAINMAPEGVKVGPKKMPRRKDDYAEMVRDLFHDIAMASGNRILAGFVSRLSDWLHHVRLKEHLVFTNLDSEMTDLQHSLSFSPSEAMDALAAYHVRRMREVGRLAATMR